MRPAVWVDERWMARGNIPDPGALDTGSGEKGMEGGQGYLVKRCCKPRDLIKHSLLVCS